MSASRRRVTRHPLEQQPLEPRAAAPREAHGDAQGVRGPRERDRLRVGETLPRACDARDVAYAFGISLNTVYDWHAAGKLRRFELRRPMGSRRWSGLAILHELDAPAGHATAR